MSDLEEKSFYIDPSFQIIRPSDKLSLFRSILGLDSNIHEIALTFWLSITSANPYLKQALSGTYTTDRINPINFQPRESILLNGEVLGDINAQLEVLSPKTIPFDTVFTIDPYYSDGKIRITGQTVNEELNCEFSYSTNNLRTGFILKPEWEYSNVPLRCDFFVPAKFNVTLAPIYFYYYPPSFPYKLCIDKFEKLSFINELLDKSNLLNEYYGYSNNDVLSKVQVMLACYIINHIDEIKFNIIAGD